jgi:CheY-like chemotaxis protein
VLATRWACRRLLPRMANAPLILIVEDDVTTAMLIGIQIKALGYRVGELLKNGEDVLSAVREKRPDLIVMDVWKQR